MKQIQVNPRLVGWSGDWAFEEVPYSRENSDYSVDRYLGDRLGIHPYTHATVAVFGEDDEGRVFVYRDGQLLAEPRPPQGMPDWLDRGEGESE